MRPARKNTTGGGTTLTTVVLGSRKAVRRALETSSALALGAALFLLGCGGSTAPLPPPPPDPIHGFISYDLIRTHTTPTAPPTDATTSGAGGEIIPAVNDILNIGALAFPELAPLSAVTGWITAGVSSAQINNEINTLFTDVAELQTEVTTLQTELNFLDTDFMKFVQAQTETDEHAAYVNFVDSLNEITSTSTGVFYLFEASAGIDSSGPVDYSTLVANIPAINEKLTGLSAPFVTSINNLSGSQLPIVTPTTDVYKSVEAFSNSTVELLYVQMQDFLYVNFPQFPNATSDIVPSLNEYNQQIVYVFQTAAAALQAAYSVDASINQINYYQGTLSPGPTPALEMETNPAIYYTSGGAASDVTTYSSVQQELALVYAARYNSLLELATSYIISDAPFNTFTYPSMATGNADLDKFYANQTYQNYFGNTVPSSKMGSTSTTGQNFPVINVTNSDGYVFYIFTGLNNFTSCQNAFVNGVALDADNCSSVYGSYPVASEPGTYDGQNLQVWLISPTTDEPYQTEATNLWDRCDSGSMSNSTWEVTSAFVEYNNTSGFSCPASQSVTQGSSPAFSPSWTYSASGEDPHNTFTWETRSTGFQWVTGNTSSLSGGEIQVETARVTEGTQISLGLDSNNVYYGALAFDISFTDQGDEEVVTFTFYCPTYDPICTPYAGTSAQGPGICFGGRYVTVYQNGEENNIGYIQDNGPC